MVDRGLLVVTGGVIDDTEVDVGKELASNVSDLLMLGVEVNSILVVLWLSFSDFHIIDTDAVVGESFTMNITDGLANLEELLVLINRKFELSKIIVQDTG